MNELLIAPTQQGKTTWEARTIVEHNGPLVVIDKHGTLVDAVLPKIRGNVLVDDYSRTDRVLALQWLQQSDEGSERQRYMHNEMQVRQFADSLASRRDLELRKVPLIEEWLTGALWLLQEQMSPVPLRVLPFAFMPLHPVFNHLVENCRKSEIAWKFKELRTMNLRDLRGEVGPALRIANTIRSPAFAARCDGTFDIGKFMEANGKLLIKWGKGASEDACRTMSLMTMRKLDQYIRNRTKNTPRVLEVLEEANAAELIGKPEIRSLEETQKMGKDTHILVQQLDFPPEIQRPVLSNCLRHRWFRTVDPEMAKLGADDLATPMLDPKKVHHTEERRRQVHNGVYEETVNDRIQLVADYRDEVEQIDRYESLEDQIKMFRKELMNLNVGQNFVRDLNGVRKEYRKPMENPWPWPRLAEKKLAEKLAKIYERPEYTSGEKKDDFVIVNSSTSSTTPARLRKRRTSTRPTRKHTEESQS